MENIAAQKILQSPKTPKMRGFVFSNYQNLNNGNLLLKSEETLALNKMAMETYIAKAL